MMCARGLLILACCEGLNSEDSRYAASKIFSSLIRVIVGSQRERTRIRLSNERMQSLRMVDLMVANYPQETLLEYVMHLQSSLSDLVTYSGTMIDMELLRGIILTLDYLHWINFEFKREKFQISQKEFLNEEVGTAVELTPHVQLWGKVMIPAARNK